MICNVRVFHIRPEAYAIAHRLPVAHVLPDALLALGDKRLYAVFLDLLLAVQPQKLFDFELYGQAVRIPARLAQNVVALHSFIAEDNIFIAAA